MSNIHVNVNLSNCLIHANMKTCDGVEKQFAIQISALLGYYAV